MPFPLDVRENLAKKTGGLCSSPSCRRAIGIPGKDSDNIGEAAHIFSGRPNGPRPGVLDDEGWVNNFLNSEANGLWLCRTCHGLIDRFWKIYPPQKLFYWKKEAADFNARRMNVPPHERNFDPAIQRSRAENFIHTYHLEPRNAIVDFWKRQSGERGMMLVPDVVRQAVSRAGVQIRWHWKPADRERYCDDDIWRDRQHLLNGQVRDLTFRMQRPGNGHTLISFDVDRETIPRDGTDIDPNHPVYFDDLTQRLAVYMASYDEFQRHIDDPYDEERRGRESQGGGA